MFSTVASVLFVPSATVFDAVHAVKKANFSSGPVIGVCALRCITLCININFNFYLRKIFASITSFLLGLQLRRQMREGRDKVGARTSDSHGENLNCFCADAGWRDTSVALVARFLATAGNQYIHSCSCSSRCCSQ